MELIKITERNGQQAVSARELHKFLESKRDFSNWIKDRIEKYGFIENQDFEVFNNFGENPNGGRPAIEYALTIDTAKELAMVEGNDKGKQARIYFIECEKQLKFNCRELPMLPIPINELKKNLAQELGNLIENNLYKGDIQEVAAAYDIEPYKIRRVLKGKTYDSDILKTMYEKAMQNKAVLKDGLQVMIDNLKS